MHTFAVNCIKSFSFDQLKLTDDLSKTLWELAYIDAFYLSSWIAFLNLIINWKELCSVYRWISLMSKYALFVVHGHPKNTTIDKDTVKPLITNTSEEFIKCRLDNFSMSFILYYVNFSICENK